MCRASSLTLVSPLRSNELGNGESIGMRVLFSILSVKRASNRSPTKKAGRKMLSESKSKQLRVSLGESFRSGVKESGVGVRFL
jgi:hypothetical protein